MANIPAAVEIVAQALTQHADAAEIVDRLIASGYIIGAQSSHVAAFDAQFRAAGGAVSS